MICIIINLQKNDIDYKGIIGVTNDTMSYIRRRVALFKQAHPELKDKSDEELWYIIQQNDKNFKFKRKKEEQ